MATRNGKPNVRSFGWLILSIGCGILLSATVSGQTVGDPAKATMQEMDRRELQLSGTGRESPMANDPKRARAIMDQVGEDFLRILTLHNQIVRALATNSSLSSEFISDATGEIKKRATRLQVVLKLQKPESTEQNRLQLHEARVGVTKDDLILLCKQIESFVRNPIIEKPGTVDAQQLEKARHDIETVVELSTLIKKSADVQKRIR